MLSSINIILGILWFFSAVVDYSDFCYLWQLKEYRVYRMLDFMSTQQGRKFWRRYIILWRSGIAIIIFFWPINSILTIKYFLILIFSIELLRNIYLFFLKKLKHPVFTKKAILVILASLLFEGGLFLLTRDWALLFLLMIIRFVILSIIVLIFKFPTFCLKKYYIDRAEKKISTLHNLTVIGITGSYGKSSVKNFLFHILNKKFKTIKTPKNINTDIGVAKFILNHDFKNIDIFIVEMGAYHVGEIKAICDMVHPKMGILTAITEQHLSLFGDIKSTQQAKYELVRSIPKNGYSIVNIDNKYCREYLDELESQVLTFGTDPDFSPTCLIKNAVGKKDGLTSTNVIGNDILEIETSIVGEHNAMNIAPCILVARQLKLSNAEIIDRCKTLKAPTSTLNVFKYGNSTIIDDTYNSNYDGFCAALDVLSFFSSKGKRVVITRGIPELGPSSDEIHEKIGEEITYNADLLILVNKDFEKPLRKGIGNKYKTQVRVLEDPKDLLNFIKKFKKKNNAILIENRIPDSVYNEIKSNEY